jgi:fused signal recognition particle receptor
VAEIPPVPEITEPVAEIPSIPEITEPAAEIPAAPEVTEPIAEIAATPEISEPIAEIAEAPEVTQPVAEIPAVPEITEPVAEIPAASQVSAPIAEIPSIPEIIKPSADALAQLPSQEDLAAETEGAGAGQETEAKVGWFGRFKRKFASDEGEAVIGEGEKPPVAEADLAADGAPERVPEGGHEGATEGFGEAETGIVGPEAIEKEVLEEEAEPKVGWFGRLKKRLSSTRDALAGRLERALSAVRTIDDDVLDELEEILITSDLGITTTNDILYKIRGQVAKKELKDVDALKLAIRKRILEMVNVPAPVEKDAKPFVQMVVGVNGVGKTTTIAKLARIYQKRGKKVLLAAGDTFRAAAVEQLIVWAKRLGVEIVSQPTGADPSAVVFDALSAAQARDVDVVIIDTAGRLHTKVNLMDELKKIKRVADKALPGAPHETILVLDAHTGQNAASQAKIFHESVHIDSLIVTKLDGTSKGGVIVSIINEYKLPIQYIGIGESFEDLRPFNAQDFIEAILGPAVGEGE